MKLHRFCIIFIFYASLKNFRAMDIEQYSPAIGSHSPQSFYGEFGSPFELEQPDKPESTTTNPSLRAQTPLPQNRPKRFLNALEHKKKYSSTDVLGAPDNQHQHGGNSLRRTSIHEMMKGSASSDEQDGNDDHIAQDYSSDEPHPFAPRVSPLSAASTRQSPVPSLKLGKSSLVAAVVNHQQRMNAQKTTNPATKSTSPSSSEEETSCCSCLMKKS